MGTATVRQVLLFRGQRETFHTPMGTATANRNGTRRFQSATFYTPMGTATAADGETGSHTG